MKFMQALEEGPFETCPACGSKRVGWARACPLCFNGYNDKELGKIESLLVTHCYDCGYTGIEDF
jgi:uncharacterized OB-fold protein